MYTLWPANLHTQPSFYVARVTYSTVTVGHWHRDCQEGDTTLDLIRVCPTYTFWVDCTFWGFYTFCPIYTKCGLCPPLWSLSSPKIFPMGSIVLPKLSISILRRLLFLHYKLFLVLLQLSNVVGYLLAIGLWNSSGGIRNLPHWRGMIRIQL